MRTQRRQRRRLVLVISAVLFAVGFVSSFTQQLCFAQDIDIVEMKRTKSPGNMKRKGTIQAWEGPELSIRVGQRDITIDNELIISVQTSWPIEYSNALEFIAEGRSDLAIKNLSNALEKESRPWAQTIIRSKLISELMLVDQIEPAIQQYISLLQEDGNSRFVHLAPLAWTNSSRQVGKADVLMQQRVAMIQLIGASWSLNGPKRAAAIKLLEELVDDIDPRVSSLARAQLWRTRASASERQLEVWDNAISEMPRECRSGPRFILAGLQSRAGADLGARLNWMKVVTQHESQRDLVAASLYACGRKLMPTQLAQGNILLDELKRRFPESKLAGQANVVIPKRDAQKN